MNAVKMKSIGEYWKKGLLLPLIGGCTLISLFVGVFFYNSKIKSYSEIENTLKETISLSLVNSLVVGDYIQLNGLLANFGKSFDIDLVISDKSNKTIALFKNVDFDSNDNLKFYNYPIYDSFGNHLGTLGIRNRGAKASFFRELAYFILGLTCFTFIAFFSIMKRSKVIYNDLKNLSGMDFTGKKINFKETFQLLKQIEDQTTKIVNLKKDEERSKIASQVAHDIRSPLAALDMIMKDVSDLPEEKRLMMRSSVSRIHDIANDLIIKNKDKENNESDSLKKVLISGVINSVVTEKRLQFRDKFDIKIDLDMGNSYGVFCDLDVSGVSRVISNLINNGVEALVDGKGVISVSLKHLLTNDIQISIIDNGKGISKEVSSKIFERGFSFGKTSGSGLGLAHAKSVIESHGGNIELESKVGQGTTFIITLNSCEAPDNFASHIKIRENSKVVIVDDDQSIHQIWKGRFESACSPEERPELIHFSNPTDFIVWEKCNVTNVCRYLIDYEFIRHKVNGIDLIRNLGIHDSSILVTSRFEEPNIQDFCNKNNIKILSKGLAGFVPIEVENDEEKFVLLDDDKLIRSMWKIAAKGNGINLSDFSNEKDLLSSLNEFPLSTTFYIDSNLSDNTKGQDVAQFLFQNGYKNLYIQTGYDPSAFEDLAFIKGVTGKDCPWSL